MKVIDSKSGTITRPADTTAYAAGDLVANSTTAGSVTPITFNFNGSALLLSNVTIRKTKADVSNTDFRVWFLSASPTVTNGDNGAIAGSFLSSVVTEPVIVSVDTLLTGGGAIGSLLFQDEQVKLPSPCYVLLEARGAYTPASGEVFTVVLTGASL